MNNCRKIAMSIMAVVLVLIMAFTLPLQVAANMITDTDNISEYALDNTNQLNVSTEAETESGNIIGEDKTKRDEYTKYFITDAGTTIAAQYAVPVHYKNAEGEYVDFDNSLHASEVTVSSATQDEATADEVSAYSLRASQATVQVEEILTNKKSNSKVSHFKKSGKEKLVKITRDNHTISWGYSGANIVDAKEQNNSPKELTGNDAYLNLQNLSSTVLYENIYNNIDLEVINSTTGVKENIILKASNAKNIFNIEYNIGDLTAESIDSRTIELKSSTGEVKFTISAPYMIDATGEQSEALELKILKNNKGKLSLKLTADKTWLKDSSRAYPITIDPNIVFDDSNFTVTTAYVNSGSPDKVLRQSTSCVISKTDEYECYSLFKINELPEMNVGEYIVNSELNVYPMSPPVSNIQLRAHKVTSAWSLDTATYNNTTYDTSVIDYANIAMASEEVITLDITKLVKEWYKGIPNNGVLLKTEDLASITLGGYCCYLPNCRPMFTIAYKNYVGTEPQLTYRTHSTNIYGAGYVSDALGTVVLRQTLVEESGSRMPVKITMTYNSLLSDTYLNNGSVMGNGWHISFNRYIAIPSDELQELGYEYVYTDEDGTEHYFTEYEPTGEELSSEGYVDKWVDEDGLGYVITKSDNDVLLEAGNGVVAKFNNPLYGGKIISETDEYGNMISYIYTDGNLTRIIDGAGREYTISYNTNSTLGIFRVNRIDMPDGSQVLFTYGSTTGEQDYMHTISYSDREIVTFAYDESANRVSSVQSTCGSNTNYLYNDNGCVSKIIDVASGNYLNFTYNPDNTTRIEDKQGRCEIYTFDNACNTVSVLNADGHLENTSDSSGNIFLSTSSDSYTKNHIVNSSIETSDNYYVTYGDSNNKGSCVLTVDTTVVNGERVQYLGNRSLRIRNTDNTQETWGYQTISTTELVGKDVTFSSYVKTSDVILDRDATGLAGVFLKMIFYNSSGSVISEESSYAISGTNRWQRISVTGFAPEGTVKVRVCFGIKNASGTAWFDCLQCESASCMNDFNALANSNFSTSDFWDASNSLSGNTDETKRVTQTVKINKSNVSFNMFGTAKATSVPLKDGNRTFGIQITLAYSDGGTEVHYQPFNPYTSAKQSVNLYVTPARANVVISTVDFSFVYDYNVGVMTAYDCMLNFEDNMYSDEELSGSTEDTTINAYNGYVYTYDSFGNVLACSQGTVIPSTDGEDVIDSSKSYITTSTTYDASGNYIASEMGSRGSVVTYSVNSNNGRVNSITDARGNVTSYTYDAFGNVLSETKGNVTNTFTYVNIGNLTAISHNGFSYNFAYDGYGNRTSTSIGNRTIATNTYGNDGYSLISTTFGNGDVINYTYDDMGNIVQVSNDDEILAEYVYNKKGIIAREIDNSSGRITDYWCNVSGVSLGTTTYQSDGSVVAYSTDSSDTGGNRITVSSVGNDTRVVTCGTDENNNCYVDNDGWNTTVVLDSLGRIINKSTTPENQTAFMTNYTYVAGNDDNATTKLVESMSIERGDADIISYSYTYDNNGNILKEYQNGAVVYTYFYDSLNRLTGSGDYINNTYTTYTYDNGGNVVRKLVQNLHPSYGYPTTVVSDDNYAYNDTEWKDLLTNYNEDIITYDTVGNPLSYRDTITMTWKNGHKLATLTKGGKTVSFTYAANGMRTEKNSNGVVTQYFYDSNKNLISLKQGDIQLAFYYDTEGQLESVLYRSSHASSRYYYVKNLQGDIVTITNERGTVIANYTYDPYGKLLKVTNSSGAEIASETSIAHLNPFRYRGYVFDNESGFYYLNGNYYDPELCRFVCANTSSNSINYYSYSDNNPISSLYARNNRKWAVSMVNGNNSLASEIENRVSQLPSMSSVGRASYYLYESACSWEDYLDGNFRNCYAYAIDYHMVVNPGDISGLKPTDLADVISRWKSVEADLLSLGYSVRILSGCDALLYDNEVKIAFRMETSSNEFDPAFGQYRYNYHFMLQTITGQWADKRGMTESKLWDVGQTPDNIPWGFDKRNSISEIIYFAVGK